MAELAVRGTPKFTTALVVSTPPARSRRSGGPRSVKRIPGVPLTLDLGKKDVNLLSGKITFTKKGTESY